LQTIWEKLPQERANKAVANFQNVRIYFTKLGDKCIFYCFTVVENLKQKRAGTAEISTSHSRMLFVFTL